MTDPTDDSPGDENCEVLFQSAYGGFPKFAMYGLLPFLILSSAVLFVRVVWFGDRITIKGFKLSPDIVAYWICPAIFLLCALIIYLAVYRHFHPQRIVVTEDELLLPKGRFTAEINRIRWHDLTASIWSGQISFIDIYEVTCIDGLHGSKTKIASNLFRDFDDFATFALIVGQHMGEDWSIKGFLPGAICGNRKQARRATDRIRFHEDT